MKNVYFPEEDVSEDDLYFMCYMIERTARTLHVHNSTVVNSIGYKHLCELISVANVLHCENPLKVEADWIEEFQLQAGDFNILDVDKELVDNIPTPLQMGKVYKRLIVNTLNPSEDFVQGIIRIYNSEICKIIDDYNSSAYYEPSLLDNTVIGAGSIVTKDIPSNVVAVGNPCRVLREIGEHDKEYYFKDRKIDYDNIK